MKQDTRTEQEFSADVDRALCNIRETLISKRRAYGPGNLTRFGPIGIVIRMSDKIDRLTNRYNSNEDSVGGMDNDTVSDSWMDIAGYAILGLSLHEDVK